jgi:hypothetical protein
MIGRDDQDIAREIEQRVKTLRELAGGEAMSQLRGLLLVIDASYKQTLAGVSASELALMQGALRQNDALHEAIFGREGSVPRL